MGLSITNNEQMNPTHSLGEIQNHSAFAALKSDGSVVTWGDVVSGGDSSLVASKLSSDVVQVFSAGYAFAALKSDGSVITWGDVKYGGDSSLVASQLTSGVVQVFSDNFAFAALKSDGSVVTWGENVSNSINVAAQLTSGVIRVFSDVYAFAALKSDGSVVTWGSTVSGGDSSSVSSKLTSGVLKVFHSSTSFAALKNDGSVVTWGNADSGGDSSRVASHLTSGVVQVFSNDYVFAALKNDGSVVTWGAADRGGDSSSVAGKLTSGVVQVFSNGGAFAALKKDGSVVTWGFNSLGGDSSSVAEKLSGGVVQVFSNGSAFAALKNDGSLVTWGRDTYGGYSGFVTSKLASGVVNVFSTTSAFAALKSDGSVVTWGDYNNGGDSSLVASKLTSGVVQVFANGSAFTALKNDGSVVTWGFARWGGDSNSMAEKLSSDVIGINNISTNDIYTRSADPVLSIAVNNANQFEGNSGITPYTFMITRLGDTSRTSSASWSVIGSGTNPANAKDFTGDILPTGSVNFATGETSKLVTINIAGDVVAEPNETFTISLTSPIGAILSSASSVTSTIKNDDSVVGSSTNDILNTFPGNDTIDGGSGIDTVVYAGNLSNYKLTKSGNNYIVAAKTGSDGTDTLNNIEALKFTDMTVNLSIKSIAAAASPTDVAHLMELYVAFFNRVPDADGLAYWIGQMKAGQSIEQIATSFYNAGVQFSSVTGFSPSMTNQAFVNVIYKNVLGRTDGGDPAGVAYWTNQLASGNSSRSKLVSTMLNAAHGFKGDTTSGFGWVADLLDNKIAVAKTIAVDFGINYNTPEASITNGVAIAAQVSATDISAALKLIGISAADISLG